MKRPVLAALVISWFAAGSAWAHKPSDAQLRLAVRDTAIAGRLDIAVRDLDAALGIDSDGNGQITWAELSASAPQITAYVEQRLVLDGGAADCKQALGTGALATLSDGAYWAIPVSLTCARAPETVAIGYSLLFDIDSMHRGLARVGKQTVILGDARPVKLELAEASSFGSFVKEGIWHIWIGIDHILFLLCLILPAVFQRSDQRWHAADSLRDVCREVIETVTAFTLAHSITLIISAIGLVSLPSRLVETAIAISVVAAALNNILRTIDARWAVAFVLGLLHGFGFSNVLFDLGLPSHELVTGLLGLNIGVEIGQAAIVAITVPLLYWIRRTIAYQALLWGGSAVVAVIATMWSYQRWFLPS